MKEDLDVYNLLVILYPNTFKPLPVSSEVIDTQPSDVNSNIPSDELKESETNVNEPQPPAIIKNVQFDPTVVHKSIDRDDFLWYLCRVINSSYWIVDTTQEDAAEVGSPGGVEDAEDKNVVVGVSSEMKIANRLCLWLKGFVRLASSRTSNSKRGSARSPGRM